MAKARHKPQGFHMQIKTEGRCFDGDQQHGCPAVVSLVRKVCVDLGMGKTAGFIKDVNGNRVGSWRYKRQRD